MTTSGTPDGGWRRACGHPDARAAWCHDSWLHEIPEKCRNNRCAASIRLDKSCNCRWTLWADPGDGFGRFGSRGHPMRAAPATVMIALFALWTALPGPATAGEYPMRPVRIL